MAEDRMLNDEILLGLIKKNGGGGTTNYNLLENKPQIAGTELQGDKSLADLGIASAQSVSNITNGENINDFAGVETALGNKQGKLTAGDYISIANGEISVDREIPSVIAEYEIKTEPMVEGQAFISVTKTVNGEVVLTQKYGSSTAGINQGINFDENIYVDYSKTASWSWTYKLRNASVDHAANYTQSWNYGSTVDYTEEFYVTDHRGDKLVIKSEMDTALADKQNATDNNLQTTDKTIVGGINELKSGLNNLTANAYGNYVDISGYTSDMYTCDNDGYLLMATNTTSTMTVYVYGRIGNDYMPVSSVNGINTSVYVRKGMRLLVHDTSGASTVARFYPLVV